MKKMKKKETITKATVYLMSFVLMFGFAGLGTLVYADSANDTSDITVETTYTTVTIHQLVQGAVDLTDSANAVDTTVTTIDIELLVDRTDGTDDDIEDLTASFNYGGEGAQGDAIIEYSLAYVDLDIKTGEGWGVDGTDTTVDQAIYEASLTIVDMMRYGVFGDWVVTANVEDTGGNTDTDTQNFAVSTFVQISVDTVTIQGTGSPGQTLGMDASVEGIDRVWSATDTITTYRINSAYAFTANDPITLYYETNELTGFTVEGYLDGADDVQSGAPIDSNLEGNDAIAPQYTLTIDAGAAVGTYTGTVTHTLSNSEVTP